MTRTARISGRIALALLAGTVLTLDPTAALAQKPKPAAAANAELRPIFATVPDIIEGKRLAEVSCARCHGANGVSATSGVPHIAAQRPSYLYAQLRAYLQGSRPQSAMTGAVKFLSDDALVKVAAYYGTLDPARPAAAPKPAAKGKAAAQTDPVLAGKAAAESCGGCHGDNGVSKTPGSPSLVGLDPKYLVAAINAYKSGPAQGRHDEGARGGPERRRHRQHRAVSTRCRSRRARARPPRATPRRARRPPAPAPAATATPGSPRTRRIRASQARTRSTSPPRRRPTRTARARTRR